MANLISDIASYLEENEVGTVGTTIFKGYLPEKDGTTIAVMNTGGLAPDIYLPTKEPTFQVFIRSASYETGLAILDSVRDLLHQQNNIQLVSNGIYFYFIFAISEGGHLGRDEAGRDLFSMNFRARTR